MKRTIGIVGTAVLALLTSSAIAQTEPPKTDPQTTWDPQKNPTVAAISSQYKGKMIPAKAPLTTEEIFPVIGTYESTTNTDAPSVSVMLDEQNRGIIWINGLPQGNQVKAMLRKSPSTYKIPAQKTADGKDIPEGTLIFDKETGALSIALNKPYNVENPNAAFETATTTTTEVEDKGAKTKTKTKVKKAKEPKAWIYTGTKVVLVKEEAPKEAQKEAATQQQ